MAWIVSYQELARHPKTGRLARLLKVSRPTAIGHLHLLWWWAMDYAPDGDLSKFKDDEIAEACMWEGDPNIFLNALIDAGFVDFFGDGEGIAIHDWDDYAGRLIDKREQAKERTRNWRNGHAQKAQNDVMHNERITYAPTEQNRTEQNRTESKTLAQPTARTRAVDAVKLELTAWFNDCFWPAYPRKVDKAMALQKLLSIRPSTEQRKAILEALEAAKVTEAWCEEGGKYIPYPKKWLNGARWEDQQAGPPQAPPRNSRRESAEEQAFRELEAEGRLKVDSESA